MTASVIYTLRGAGTKFPEASHAVASLYYFSQNKPFRSEKIRSELWFPDCLLDMLLLRAGMPD